MARFHFNAVELVGINYERGLEVINVASIDFVFAGIGTPFDRFRFRFYVERSWGFVGMNFLLRELP